MKTIDEMTLDELLDYLKGQTKSDLVVIAQSYGITRNVNKNDLIRLIHKSIARKRDYEKMMRAK